MNNSGDDDSDDIDNNNDDSDDDDIDNNNDDNGDNDSDDGQQLLFLKNGLQQFKIDSDDDDDGYE